MTEETKERIAKEKRLLDGISGGCRVTLNLVSQYVESETNKRRVDNDNAVPDAVLMNQGEIRGYQRLLKILKKA